MPTLIKLKTDKTASQDVETANNTETQQKKMLHKMPIRLHFIPHIDGPAAHRLARSQMQSA